MLVGKKNQECNKMTIIDTGHNALVSSEIRLVESIRNSTVQQLHGRCTLMQPEPGQPFRRKSRGRTLIKSKSICKFAADPWL